MVKKLDLRPSLPRLIGGLQRQSTQGIARPTSRLVVQEPHDAPAGESVIPSRDVVYELTDARDRLDDMDEAIATASRRYIITDEGSPLDATEPEEGWPDGAIWQQVDGNNIVIGRWVRDVDAWTPMKDGGAVLHAETVAAVVGVFIDGMMENLTVTGAANISEAALGTLTARIANILTLNAEQVIVGQDFRFWSGGLVLYAPIEEGQDPNDWPNRTPVLTITPGDVSLSVSQDGVITAGITPTGEVWGTYGAFDQLAVAGQDVLDLIRSMPRGICNALRLEGPNFPINSSATFKFGLRYRLEKDRMYKVTYSLSATATTWPMGVVLYAVWNGWAVQQRIMSNNIRTTEPFLREYVFRGDELDFEAGDNVGFYIAASTSATGSIYAGSEGGNMMTIEDIGPAIDIEVVQGSGSPPPTAPPEKTYTTTITSSPGVPIRPDGSFAPDGRRMVGGQSQGYGSDMSEHVYYPLNLSPLAGSTILSARVSFTVTLTKYGGTPVALRWDTTTGYLNGRTNFYNGAHNVGAGSGAASSSTRQSFVGRQGVLASPLYPGNSTQGYGGLGERVTVVIKYRK